MNAPNAFVITLFEMVEFLLGLYMWVLIIGAILSWLVAFGVVNKNNRFVETVGDFIFRVTEPALKPIRRVLPPYRGIDFSPLVLILIIMFLQRFIAHLVF